MKTQYTLMTLAIVLLGISACSDNQAAVQQQMAPTAVAVKAITVERKQVSAIDEYPASVVPKNEVELRPQISGTITNIFIQDGQTIKKGQKLYEIDRSKYLAAKQQAEAAVAIAESNLARITKDLERYVRLSEKDAIAKQQVDYAKADLLSTQSQLASAKAQLESAATDLSYTIVTAPFDGTIGISQVRLGAQVSPGQPLLNTLSSDNPILVNFSISEREIPRFNRLMKGTDTPDSLFTISLHGGSIYPFVGELVTIDRAVGRQTGTINLRVKFDNPNRDLISGMTVSMRVINQDYGQQVVIPYKAVTEQMGEYFVYVIDDENTVTQRTLELGSLLGGNVAVRSGLKPGEKIVFEGIQKLRQGAKVAPEMLPSQL
ncbi:efflux RND transporter periplasmic adaptor subunit [Roseivirga echinicomitans]